MQTLLTALAKLLAATPVPILDGLSAVFGSAIYRLFPKRRRIILSNLHHAFPSTPHETLEAIAEASCARMIEMSLLSFCAGQFSTERIRDSLHVSASTREFYESKKDSKRPVLYLVPHLTLMEMQPWLKTVVPSERERKIICIYRSLNQKALEAHVKLSRETHGTQFRARKEGFVESMQCLRHGGQVSILFDQNARKSGALVLFMGRLCAATDLPGILAKKFNAELRMIWVERKGFWRGELKVEQLPEDWSTSSERLTAGAQIRLEQLFETAPHLIQDWLWSHNRWRAEVQPDTRFALQNKKVWLQHSAELAGLSEIPRKTRAVMHLPAKLQDMDALIPILARIRTARPDMAFWMMGTREILAKLNVQELADRCLEIDTPTDAITMIKSLEREYIDIVCDWDPESPLAKLWHYTRCTQVFGWNRKSGAETRFTHAVEYPENTTSFADAALVFATRFGLRSPEK